VAAAIVWRLGGWLAARRRPKVLPEDVQRWAFRHQLRGMNVRLTERLRDRLRPSWLRLRREDGDTDKP